MDDLASYWYCLTYVGQTVDGEQAHSSMYVAQTVNIVNLKTIDGNKKSAGMNKDAVLISCSYLGLMTRKEFTAGTCHEQTTDTEGQPCTISPDK